MNTQSQFNKTYDEALLVYSVLKRLGAGGVSSFDQRLKSQKIQYFAQVLKVVPPYRFNLYLRGPYSPGLAHDLFLIDHKSIDADTSPFVSDELEGRFMKLKELISGKTVRQLEVAATLHWFLKVVGRPRDYSVKRVKELKGASQDEIKSAFGFLAKVS